jgi:hypothetical protein
MSRQLRSPTIRQQKSPPTNTPRIRKRSSHSKRERRKRETKGQCHCYKGAFCLS